MKYSCVRRCLCVAFKKLGVIIGCHPLYFVLIPFALTLLLSAGFSQITISKDAEYLYVPINGRAVKDREAVEKLFPPNESRLDFGRISRLGRSGIVIMEAKDRGTMLRETVIDDFITVDKIVNGISVRRNNATLIYKVLCIKTITGDCIKNDVLDLKGKSDDINNKSLRIRYPVHVKEGTMSAILYGINLGGVTTDEDGYVNNVKAVRLIYFLKYQTTENNLIGLIWEKKFLKAVSKLHLNNIYVYRFVTSALDEETNRLTEMTLPLIYSAAPIMVLFSVVSCLTSNWVTSKPWIGISGCISSVFSTVSSYGLLLFCGAPYVEINIITPFLLLGIGLDDSFILLAAWRRTHHCKTVPERMSDTYSEAALSITITSLTNFLSFCIGMTTPFHILRVQCLYAAVSILLSYIFQITFFGGMLDLSGYREQKNLHALFFTPVNLSVESKNTAHRLVFVECMKTSANSLESNAAGPLDFYRDKIGTALIKKWIKLGVIIGFILYFIGGVYSLRYLQEGIDMTHMVPYNSYIYNFTIPHYKYFGEYAHIVQVVINKTLDYSDPSVQREVQNIVTRFASAPKMAGAKYIDSWLTFYLASMADRKLTLSYRGYNMTDSADFIEGLDNVFLKLLPFRRFNQDILFDGERKRIIATRFLVQSKNIFGSDDEKELLSTLWNIAVSCKYPVYVHHYWFVMCNQHVLIKVLSIQALCTTGGVMLAVFVVFVPHYFCVISVAVTIASIQVGVIGFMSLWDVRLDAISMVCLIAAAGLSVDYASHISFAYVVSKESNPNKKLKAALHATGHPVIQGCFSTILGLVVFPFGSIYIFVVFFKIFMLVTLLSALHGLFVLPVCISVLDAWSQRTFDKKTNMLINGKTSVDT